VLQNASDQPYNINYLVTDCYKLQDILATNLQLL